MKSNKIVNRLMGNSMVLFLYTLFFFVLTWPSSLHLKTHILGDSWDGFQMYWNLWWVRRSIVNGGMRLFETSLLFFPKTPNLLVHSLHPFGGLLTIPFSPFLNDVEMFNLVVIFAFAVSGWGVYLLARHLNIGVFPALIGGYIFTFCSYHFAHATGHLNLILMQWIPFYFLFFLRLIARSRLRDAFLSAIFLFLVLLCDHYYFLFCVLASVVFIVWGLFFKTADLVNSRFVRAFSLFFLLALSTSGVFIFSLLKVVHEGNIVGHNASVYGMDLFALLIPGGHWHWHAHTASYWIGLNGGNYHESSVHVGFGAVCLAVCGFHYLQKRRENMRFLWLFLFLFFFWLSLGKDLQIFGSLIMLPMPYEALGRVLPIVGLGGVPVRFIVVAVLALSIFAAYGAQMLLTTRKGRIVVALLLCAVILELYPRPIPVRRVSFPLYIEFLAQRAEVKPGAVLDLAHTPPFAMVYQTRHRQPIHTGYLARMHCSIQRSYAHVQSLIQQQRFSELGSEWKFRYVLSKVRLKGCRLIFDGPVQVYEIKGGH